MLPKQIFCLNKFDAHVLLRRDTDSSGSCGRVRGAEKHEIYMTAFGGHLFMTNFYRAGGEGMAPLAPWICYCYWYPFVFQFVSKEAALDFTTWYNGCTIKTLI